MNNKTRVKFCGITRLEDALKAVSLGVDALGFVFYEKSPRNITPAKAKEIIRKLPPFVSRVGLFVNADPEEIAAVVGDVALDTVQYHGAESPAECAKLNQPYIKAVRMAPGVDLTQQAKAYAGASALLIDTFEPGLMGGTGDIFDWALVPATLSKPIILAGGLKPLNVARAIKTVRPYGIDVSTGIEREKGIKDSEKMNQFMHEVTQLAG